MLTTSLHLFLTSAFTQLPAQIDGDAGSAAGGIFGLLFCCFFSLIGIGLFAFWIWMIVDCAQRQFPGENDKLVWILIIVLTSWIGALIYFFIGRPKGRKV